MQRRTVNKLCVRSVGGGQLLLWMSQAGERLPSAQRSTARMREASLEGLYARHHLLHVSEAAAAIRRAFVPYVEYTKFGNMNGIAYG